MLPNVTLAQFLDIAQANPWMAASDAFLPLLRDFLVSRCQESEPRLARRLARLSDRQVRRAYRLLQGQRAAASEAGEHQGD